MSSRIVESNQSSKASLSEMDPEKKDVEAQQDIVEQTSRTEEDQPDEEKQQPAPPPSDPNLVSFTLPTDPANPKQWRPLRKTIITCSMGMMTFVVTFSSSIFAVAIAPVSAEYNVSTTVATLGVSLFLLGFVLGPVAFGPMSEVYGRRIPLFLGYILFAIFQIPVAVAKNIETILICRFLGGLAASAPPAIVGGAMADLWDPVERAYAICAFAAGAFCGPVAGPIAGGFVTQSYLGWRWTAWLTLILAALWGVIGLIVIPETSAQRILQLRAREERKKTGNEELYAVGEKENQVTMERIFTVYLSRPFVMIAKEPILALLTAYMSYLYGVLYLLFEAFPISFHEERKWSLGVSALPFCSFLVGTMMGGAMMAYSAATNFKRSYEKHGKAIPEERLPPMIVGAIILPFAFLWWAWTSYPTITWVPQVISTAFIGMGMLVTFWQGITYLIDCYGFYSNSAIAVNTFIRSIAGAVFPLFAADMFHAMSVRWAMTFLGLICLIFAPAPILFYKYGARVRAKSTFSPTG